MMEWVLVRCDFDESTGNGRGHGMHWGIVLCLVLGIIGFYVGYWF